MRYNNRSFNYKLLLLFLLIILNIVIRLPSVSHEVGGDTFQIHALANSLSSEGEAKWWINWLSIFGLYSYSYASSVPFSLSSISLLSGLDMELSIYVFATLIGVYSIFTSYTMASVISDNFTFKYLVSFFYSISAGIMRFTFWNASARGTFLVFFMLFIFLIFTKLSTKTKNILLLLMLVIYLRSTHNFVYFTLPFIGVYLLFYFLRTIDSINNYIMRYKNHSILSIIYSVLFISIFLFPFFTRMFVAGSRYQYLLDISITMARYVGPTLVYAITGIIFVLLNKDKNITKWIFLIVFLCYIPILYNISYGVFISLPLVVLFLTIGFSNVVQSKHKIMMVFSVLVIITSVIFSSYLTHNRLGSSDDYFYMSDEAYEAGVWTKQNFDYNSRIYTSGAEIWRMLAISDGHAVFPTLPPLALVYGFVTNVENTTIPVSPFSKDFYFEGPYVQSSGNSKWGEYQWYSNFDYNDARIKTFIENYNIEYFVRDLYSSTNKPLNTISSYEPLIYDNGRINIWRVQYR